MCRSCCEMYGEYGGYICLITCVRACYCCITDIDDGRFLPMTGAQRTGRVWNAWTCT